MMKRYMTLEEFQMKINNKYGENEWEVLTYEGSLFPTTIKHKCGNIRTIKRACSLNINNIRCECEKNNVKHDISTVQSIIDERYGENEWKILEYNGLNYPLKVVHKCGNEARFQYAKTFLYDLKTPCSKCRNSKKKIEIQEYLNEKYGENEWGILEFTGTAKPCLLKHKCGEEKRLTRGSTIKRVNLSCEICSRQKI